MPGYGMKPKSNLVLQDHGNLRITRNQFGSAPIESATPKLAHNECMRRVGVLLFLTVAAFGHGKSGRIHLVLGWFL